MECDFSHSNTVPVIVVKEAYLLGTAMECDFVHRKAVPVYVGKGACLLSHTGSQAGRPAQREGSVLTVSCCLAGCDFFR